MAKIVINSCFGGFCLSREACEFLGRSWDRYGNARDMSRDDPKLVECVESLGRQANGQFAKLKVVEIPDGVDWQIQEYDGSEWISEKHRTWF
jgi:hypothetical protein